MSASKTGCAPNIQFLSEEVDYFNIDRKVNCMLVQKVNCFKASDYTGYAIKPAPADTVSICDPIMIF